MRNLVVCCDGTWQDPSARSNVSRLCDLLDPPAVTHYVKGVGTGDLVNRLQGGLTGAGLSEALMAGYRFLVREYEPGDRISVFGFSRGAYTARSLAGMVGGVGIVDRGGLADDELDATVQRAYERYRSLREQRKAQAGQDAGPETLLATPPAGDDLLPLAYDPASPDIPVVFVGVWDTVGALGIPSYVGFPDVFHSRERYQFLNVILDPRIPHARHAVSLDEMRGPFRPTLWQEPPAGSVQDIKQVWFPGDHCDVGGGHDDSRLSQGALKWMVDEAEAAVGLPFRQADRAAIISAPAPEALHGMSRGAWGALVEAAFQPRPRATPLVDLDRPLPGLVAESAYELQKLTHDRAREQRYRPTRTLQPGEEAEVTVEANEGWNPTGLYLEPGRYRFAAAGEWRTPLGRSGPQGVKPWPVVGDAFGRAVDLVEHGLRAVLANPDAELAGARREANEPLMALVGLVANEVTDAGGTVAEENGKPQVDQKLVIGAGCEAEVRRPGYFWAYANDAWGSYGNNSGQVTLRVSRPADVDRGV
jgi:T6SS, Phospholipase effector Tle1-like, catalytic domain